MFINVQTQKPACVWAFTWELFSCNWNFLRESTHKIHRLTIIYINRKPFLGKPIAKGVKTFVAKLNFWVAWWNESGIIHNHCYMRVITYIREDFHIKKVQETNQAPILAELNKLGISVLFERHSLWWIDTSQTEIYFLFVALYSRSNKSFFGGSIFEI